MAPDGRFVVQPHTLCKTRDGEDGAQTAVTAQRHGSVEAAPSQEPSSFKAAGIERT